MGRRIPSRGCSWLVGSEKLCLEIEAADEVGGRVAVRLGDALRVVEVEHDRADILAGVDAPVREDGVCERAVGVEREVAEIVEQLHAGDVSLGIVRRLRDHAQDEVVGARVEAAVLRQDVGEVVCLVSDFRKFHGMA